MLRQLLCTILAILPSAWSAGYYPNGTITYWKNGVMPIMVDPISLKFNSNQFNLTMEVLSILSTVVEPCVKLILATPNNDTQKIMDKQFLIIQYDPAGVSVSAQFFILPSPQCP